MKLSVTILVVVTSRAVSAAFLRDGNHGLVVSGAFLEKSNHGQSQQKWLLGRDANSTMMIKQPLPTKPTVKESYTFEEMRLRGHRLVSLIMVTTFVAFLSMFVMIRSGDKVMMKSAWSVFDTTNVTIIGVSLFTAITQVIIDLQALLAYLNKDSAVSPFGMSLINVALYATYSTAVMFFAVLGSHKLKDSPQKMKVFNAIIYWVVILAKGGAIGQAQVQLGDGNPYSTIFWTWFAIVFLVILMVVIHHVKPEAQWYDAEEDSVMGGAFAAGVCSLVILLINICLKKAHGGEEADVFEQHMWFDGFGIMATLAMVFGTKPCLDLQKKYEGAEPGELSKYWKYRSCAILVAFVGVLPYFAMTNNLCVLVCDSLGVVAGTAMAKIVNTITNSTLGIVCTLACTFIPYLRNGGEAAERLSGFILGYGGFVGGYAWSAMITGASKPLLDQSVFPEGVNPILVQWSQAAFCWLLLFIHLPVYFFYMKPLIDEKVSELK